MKTILILSIFAAVSAVYTDLDETIDIDAIMSDPDQLKPYLDCYLDRAPCTPKTAAYKSHIPDLLANSCQNCDARLKHIIEEFFLNMAVRFPEEMKLIKDKYDPNGKELGKLALEVSKY